MFTRFASPSVEPVSKVSPSAYARSSTLSLPIFRDESDVSPGNQGPPRIKVREEEIRIVEIRIVEIRIIRIV